jgi:hypothetical protein
MTAFPRVPMAALAVALVSALSACGGDDSPTIETPATPATSVTTTVGTGVTTSVAAGRGTTMTTAANTFTITVRGGSVEGPSRARVKVNQSVLLRVTSDTEDEVHVHGYDERVDVGPGNTAEITFLADIAGTVEVELENSRRRLTTLEVQP